MLWTIVAILFVLWLVGLLTGTTFGGIIHVLLVIAVIAAIISLVRGRSVV